MKTVSRYKKYGALSKFNVEQVEGCCRETSPETSFQSLQARGVLLQGSVPNVQLPETWAGRRLLQGVVPRDQFSES